MRRKKILFVVAAVTLAAVFVAMGVLRMVRVYEHYREDMLSYESQHLNSIVTTSARGMETMLWGYDAQLDNLVGRQEFEKAEASYDQTGDAAVMQELLKRPDVLTADHIYSVAVYGRDGSYIGASDVYFPVDTGNNTALADGFCIRRSDAGVYWFVYTAWSNGGYKYELALPVQSAFSYHANAARIGKNGYLFMMDSRENFLSYSGNGIMSTGSLASMKDYFPGIDTDAVDEIAATGWQEPGSYSVYYYPWDSAEEKLHSGQTLVVTHAIEMTYGNIILGAAVSFREFSSILNDTLEDVSLVILLEVAGVFLLLGVSAWLLSVDRRNAMELAVVKEKADMMEEINRQQQSLEHTERLQQLGVMTSGIVHEFNNMLTPVMSQSLLLLEQLADREESPEFENALDIFEASEKAREVLLRMSSMSKKDVDMNFISMDLSSMLRKTANLAAMAKDPHVQIELRLPEEPVFVSGNDKLLSQAFLNLFINGCQAMGTEGTLTVAAETESRAGRIYVRVDVCDTGSGIPEDRIGKIYDPFFTTKGEHGTGLGLAICQKIIETHKGTIKASNRPEGGAKFSVRLPVAGGE